MSFRNSLLALPDHYFAGSMGGRIPSQIEKLALIEKMLAEQLLLQTFQNREYTVILGHVPPLVRITVIRIDDHPIRSWRDLQEIKNIFVGPECEAVEVFPAESRLMDTANEYHLWAHPDPGFRFPFGFQCVRTVIPANSI
jgi:hypothetical protein